MAPKMAGYVAWTMRDGNTMCGQVTDRIGNTLYVVRVDGGSCTISADQTRPADCDDVDAACRFFARIGL
jgi:hypothetical protein